MYFTICMQATRSSNGENLYIIISLQEYLGLEDAIEILIREGDTRFSGGFQIREKEKSLCHVT